MIKRTKKSRKQVIRTRSFLLLELLIALTLVTIALFPLTMTFTKCLVEEKRVLEKHTFQRRFRCALCKLKEDIFDGKIALQPGLKGSLNEAIYEILSIEDHPKKKCSLVTVSIELPTKRDDGVRTFVIYVERT